MAPGISTRIEPEATLKEKQAYADGFEAGKACIRQELKQLIKSLDHNDPFLSSGTFTK
jgi:hypothetical protein